MRLLADDPERVDLAIRLHIVLVLQGKLDGDIDLPGWCLSTDPHAASLQPFVFLHVPKTGGSMLRLIVLSWFDHEQVFPGHNFPDYNVAKFREVVDPARHGVFVGHMGWDAVAVIAEAFEAMPQIVTMLREPSSHAESQLAFGIKLGLPTTSSHDDCMLTSMVLFHGRAPADLGRPSLLELDYAPSFLHLTAVRFVGDFQDLRSSLDALCYELEMPFQDMPADVLNASGATHTGPRSDQGAARDVQRARRFYCYGQRRFAAVASLLDDEDRRSQLDERYREVVLRVQEPVWTVDLAVERAWPGTGWKYREQDQHGAMWRSIGNSNIAHLFVVLRGGVHYALAVTFHSVSPGRVLDGLGVAANGCALAVEDTTWQNNQCIRRWRLPGDSVDENGRVSLTFTLGEPGDCKLAAIRIAPVAPAEDVSAEEDQENGTGDPAHSVERVRGWAARWQSLMGQRLARGPHGLLGRVLLQSRQPAQPE